MRPESLCKGTVTIDLEAATVRYSVDGREETHPLGSDAGFALVSDAWLRAGWDSKYVYSFTWFGRPVIQLPDDLMRIQELFWQVKPDLVIETGVAHGGGQVFFASLCKAAGKGRAVGVELDLRAHNRAALDAHPLRDLITLVDGSSVAPATLDKVNALLHPGDTVLVVLDSNHSKAHVLAELEAYAPLVTRGSYLVATDGIMRRLAGAPRSEPDWGDNNPQAAVEQFLTRHTEFESENPARLFNEGQVTSPVTYWPSAYLKRVK
jgi:cephalosporin hydroxylase